MTREQIKHKIDEIDAIENTLKREIELLYDKLYAYDDERNKLNKELITLEAANFAIEPNHYYYMEKDAIGYHDWDKHLIRIDNIEGKSISVTEYVSRVADDDRFTRVEKSTYNLTELITTLNYNNGRLLLFDEVNKYLNDILYL